jgi:hypothetical protein
MKTMITAIAVASTMIASPAFAQDTQSATWTAAMCRPQPNAMGAQLKTDAHMVMTLLRPEARGDVERAHEILHTLRRVLADYRDSQVALDQGYRIFLPTVPQEVYHFTDYSAAANEYAGNFDPSRPGSLLYVKNSRGDYVLVGAMYSAPPDSTPAQLDALIPLSVARWHAHTDICLPRGMTLNDLLRGDIGETRIDMPVVPAGARPEAPDLSRRLGFLADGRFGFTGRIATAADCEAAGGNFIPQAFGWMTHVYPFNGDDLKVAFSTTVPKPPAN